jgi:hypothetical protein
MQLFPNLFGSKNRSTRDRYNLESMSKKESQTTWKDNMYNRSTITKGDSDDGSSQERIIGITKTVGVEVTSVDVESKGNGRTTAEMETFGVAGRR